MNESLKKLLKPLASLRLTVVLLFLSMLLVYAGTSAQKEAGIWDVQRQFFHSWYALVPVKYLMPLSDWWWQHAPGKFPLAGGYLLIVLLLANLLSAHTVRFKFVAGDLLLLPLLAAAVVLLWFAEQNANVWLIAGGSSFGAGALALVAYLHRKRTGVIVIHFGLILLLVGEIVTSRMAVESQMPIDEGASSNWTQDIRDYELAVINPSPAGHDTVVAVPAPLLAARGEVRDQRLPFEIKVARYYPNSSLLGPMQPHDGAESLATAGAGQKLWVKGEPPVPGTSAEEVNLPSAFLTFTSGVNKLGTYLVSMVPTPMTTVDRPQDVRVGDTTYQVVLRFKREYKPYTMQLLRFSHDRYVGTDTASNFSSRVRLIDPRYNEDRVVSIKMNHPLRYRGETFYQSGFKPGDGATILQVVHNPGWLLPYFACAIGALGLVIHFGIVLINFLRKQAASGGRGSAVLGIPGPPMASVAAASVTTGTATAAAAAARRSKQEAAKSRKAAAPLAPDESYTLEPKSPLRLLGPAAAVALGLILVVCWFARATTAGPAPSASSAGRDGGFDVDSFARLPVSVEGRVMPLDSLARNSLKIINGSQTLEAPGPDGKPRTLSAAQWLLDLLGHPALASGYKVFRVDHPDVKATFGLKEDEKRFSWKDIFEDPNNPDNGEKLQKQRDQALQTEESRRDAYQTKVIELYEHASLYIKLARGADEVELFDLFSHKDQVPEFEKKAQAALDLEPKQRNASEAELAERYESITRTLRMLRQPEAISDPTQRHVMAQQFKQQDLYFAAPAERGGQWSGLGQSVIDFSNGGSISPTAVAFFGVVGDYRDGRAESFNTDVSAYRRDAQRTVGKPAEKASYEVFFNRLDPFTLCMALYVLVFLTACTSWLTGVKPFVGAALAVLVLTFLVHSSGLVSRVYISGRPPVTNLYSSALFIAWGAVLLCIGLELIYRNGVGSAVAAVVGFAPLLIADGLAQRDADTMAQLQAVLDTNFWLATHVVVVTLGYAATFLAGLLAIGYVAANLVTGGLEADTRKTLTRMTYGIICFAMLFSFVGTILGGIWADQSWGRFWGWDPKENGAVLIVLWNALILHARWGGLVREKGLMLLAIGGNIITSWSWFGTNMLGIGLHSYGFVGKAFLWLTAFAVSQILLIVAGAFVRPATTEPRAARDPVIA